MPVNMNTRTPPVGAPPQGANTPADQFLQHAMQFVGQPYLWAGGHAGPMGAPGPVDCSGLVSQAAQAIGRPELNSDAAGQQAAAQPVGMDQLKPGDLVFRGQPADHVGIYIGNGEVLHATGNGMTTKVEKLADLQARGIFDNAGRIFDQAGQPVSAPAGGGAPAGGAAPDGASGGSSAGGGASGAMPPDTNATGGGGQPSQAELPPEAPPTPSGHVGGAIDPGEMMAKLEQLGISREKLEAIAQQFGVPLELLLGVIKQESGGDPNAVSGAGAQGLMQLMPGTAAELGVTDPSNPLENLMGGAKYLGQMLDKFEGDPSLALAAYNAGPGNVQKFGGIPPFAETQDYVGKILGGLEAA